jgi:uncharacterized protein (TIGR00251 family)
LEIAMRISVTVKPNSRKEEVVPSGEGEYTVRVSVPPVEGKANERVVELLARHFGVPKSRVTIVRGASGRKKLVEIVS